MPGRAAPHTTHKSQYRTTPNVAVCKKKEGKKNRYVCPVGPKPSVEKKGGTKKEEKKRYVCLVGPTPSAALEGQYPYAPYVGVEGVVQPAHAFRGHVTRGAHPRLFFVF